MGTIPASRSCAECFRDHSDIYEAIVASDSEGAARAMHRHILNTATLLITQETAKRPEFGDQNVTERVGWLTS